MIVKLFEVRDRATFVPVMAIKVSELDGYLMRRAGFGDPMVYLVHLTSETAKYDPYHWDNRTMHYAHAYIWKNFDTLEDNQVIDVEFILGETFKPKDSERIYG